MSSIPPPGSPTAADESQLAALGYSGDFHRSMSLWSNLALGFTYLSPLVGVYSLFAYSLSLGGPPAIWWIVIVGAGQLLVALVFGEVVSQYPLAGGIYPWCRRAVAKPYENSAGVPEGDAIEVAQQLRAMQQQGSAQQP